MYKYKLLLLFFYIDWSDNRVYDENIGYFNTDNSSKKYAVFK